MHAITRVFSRAREGFRERLALHGGEELRGPSSPETLRDVQRLELRTRGLVDSLFAGEYGSVFRGRGLEFSHVRGYQVGDDVRAIDWKVTARRGVPYVRQFVEERDLLVVLVVDVSASGLFAAGSRGVSEVANEITAALAFAAARNNDRVALLLVSDHVEQFIPPGSGRRHVVRLLATLLTYRPTGRGTDLTTGLARIGRALSGRALVFVVSDFFQGGEVAPFRDALARLARRHDLVAIRLHSAAAIELPDLGWVEMTDPESGRRVTIDTGSRRVRKHYRHSALRARAETAVLLDKVGADLIDIDTAGDPIATLWAFFRARRGSAR